MKAPLQRRPSGASRLAETAQLRAPSRSLPAPDTALQASSIDAKSKNGIVHDEVNDALTSSYVAHPNDPALWDGGSEYHVYGPNRGGSIGVRGEGDQHEISVNDVNQGSIGNCYFMSAIASVAHQNPELIRNAIEGPLSDGTYNVTLYSSRGWEEDATNTPVTLNVSPSFVEYGNLQNHDIDAMREWEGINAYADGADRDEQGNMELWVNLIEKAQAQLFGSWEAVDGGVGGWPMIALEVLTGESYMEHYFSGVPEHLQELYDYDRIQLTRPSSRVDSISNEELKETIIGNLAAGIPMTAESTSHAVTIMEADSEGITLRDQNATNSPDRGIRVYTWADFRSEYMKFTTQVPD